MPTKQKSFLRKVSQERTRSIFQNFRLEIKLLQELGLGLDIIM